MYRSPATRPHWRQPRWLAMATLSLALTLGLGAYLAERFRIGIDDQKTHCLPPYSVWLIDTHDRTPHRGEPFAFRAHGAMQPWFREGQVVIKRLVGFPGDRISVTATQTLVNGQGVGEGLELAGKLQRPADDFVREETVPAGHYWMMGGTPNSFDARYWGVLGGDRIVGRGYGLW